MVRVMAILAALWLGVAAQAEVRDARFPSIDGGDIAMADYAGQPVLVVNTASRCAFTDQYEGLQALYDSYRDRGLVVLAVPSNDFRQELGTAEEVAEFCELTYGIDMPMTDILHVRGRDAHPFYRAVKAQTGFVPMWNFNKVLIGPEGDVIQTWGSRTRPDAPQVTRAIEGLLRS